MARKSIKICKGRKIMKCSKCENKNEIKVYDRGIFDQIEASVYLTLREPLCIDCVKKELSKLSIIFQQK